MCPYLSYLPSKCVVSGKVMFLFRHNLLLLCTSLEITCFVINQFFLTTIVSQLLYIRCTSPKMVVLSIIYVVLAAEMRRNQIGMFRSEKRGATTLDELQRTVTAKNSREYTKDNTKVQTLQFVVGKFGFGHAQNQKPTLAN